MPAAVWRATALRFITPLPQAGLRFTAARQASTIAGINGFQLHRIAGTGIIGRV